jgi:hypothetical protein
MRSPVSGHAPTWGLWMTAYLVEWLHQPNSRWHALTRTLPRRALWGYPVRELGPEARSEHGRESGRGTISASRVVYLDQRQGWFQGAGLVSPCLSQDRKPSFSGSADGVDHLLLRTSRDSGLLKPFEPPNWSGGRPHLSLLVLSSPQFSGPSALRCEQPKIHPRAIRHLHSARSNGIGEPPFKCGDDPWRVNGPWVSGSLGSSKRAADGDERGYHP